MYNFSLPPIFRLMIQICKADHINLHKISRVLSLRLSASELRPNETFETFKIPQTQLPHSVNILGKCPQLKSAKIKARIHTYLKEIPIAVAKRAKSIV